MPSISTTFENGDQVQLANNSTVWGVVVAQKVEGGSTSRSISCLVALKEDFTNLVAFHQSLLVART